jgi:hypothetical protein
MCSDYPHHIKTQKTFLKKTEIKTLKKLLKILNKPALNPQKPLKNLSHHFRPFRYLAKMDPVRLTY